MRIFKLYSKLLIMLIVLPCAGLGVVNANEFASNFHGPSTGVTKLTSQNSINQYDARLSGTDALCKDGNSDVISQSKVIRQVKNDYNAEVLRISLSKDRRHYNVRVLMPNGKVKNIKVNAQR